MMNPSVNFESLSRQVISILEADIDTLLTHANLPQPLQAACRYAMTGQGKRVRPLLTAFGYATVQQSGIDSSSFSSEHAEVNSIAANGKWETSTGLTFSDDCRRAMLAVEFLHTYSLIHDDLPCMDDDDLRRGRPTCHIKFDEATALLAGDVLQTLAFEVLSADIEGFDSITAEQTAKLLTVFAPRARRMVSGQMLDLNAENHQISQLELEAVHRDKTGALIEAAVLMGGVCAGANSEQLDSLTQFSLNIGLAFQVQDDILDVTTSTDILGKPAGSDEGLNKSTYVRLMGVDAATDYAKTLFFEGKQAISDCFTPQNTLNLLADWLWQRQK